MFYHEYCSQLLKDGQKPYKKGVINLVTAPCGSGKSYHCHKVIERYNGEKTIYYVTDTRMPLEFVKKDLPEHVKVITYQVLGMILSDEEQRKQFFKNTYMIMLDEVHQLFRYASRFNDEKSCDKDKMFYKVAIEWLYELPKNMKVLALSGTPGDLIYHANNENKSHMINNVLSDKIVNQLHQQRIENKEQVCNMSAWLENDFELPKGEQALGYANTIDNLNTYRDILESKGYRVCVLWSKNAKGFTPNGVDKTFTDEQAELYQYLKEHNKLPNTIDVLLVNAAYESGWNLENNESNRIQTVFINTSDHVTITQITNRVRHDIRLQVTTKATPTRSDYFNREWVDEEVRRVHECLKIYWEDSHLTDKEIKNNLCNDLVFINESRRVIKTYDPLVAHLEMLYKHWAYNHFDTGNYYMSFNEFSICCSSFVNRTFAIDLVTFYDDNGKQHKNVWQIRNIVRGVKKGDKRTLFQKIQYLKTIDFSQKQVADKLEIDIKLVEDNWNEPYKPPKQAKKSNNSSKKDKYLKIQELKTKGLTQKQVAEQLNIPLRTIKRHWK